MTGTAVCGSMASAVGGVYLPPAGTKNKNETFLVSLVFLCCSIIHQKRTMASFCATASSVSRFQRKAKVGDEMLLCFDSVRTVSLGLNSRGFYIFDCRDDEPAENGKFSQLTRCGFFRLIRELHRI